MSWGVFAFLCAFLVFAQANTCERFDIRNNGQTLFAITSNDGTVYIPGDLELGSLTTNQILMGDYVWGVHNAFGEPQLGLRKRRVDPDTGKYHVPRAIRGFAYNGTHVIYDHAFRDASEFTLAELRDFMREVLAEELALEGHNDPFNLAASFTAAGVWCKQDGPDCVSSRDDMFVVVASEEARLAMLDLQTVWEREPVAGEPGYQGSVQTLSLTVSADDSTTLVNDGGVFAGAAGFRFADEEIQEVVWLKSQQMMNYEVTPGVVVDIFGWAGGNVLDFQLDSGLLKNGKIVVGPFPDSDPLDVVNFVQGDFPGLEVRTPGPALRFTPGRNTRVYVDVAGGQELAIHFGFVTPFDQDGTFNSSQPRPVMVDTTYVYEFTVPNEGTHAYRDTYQWRWDLAGPAVVGSSWDYDREYVLYAQNYDWLNGNTFPGTVERLSGWYLDTIRIKSSKLDEATGDIIVTIIDEPRIPYEGSLEDPLHPPVANDCPAYGGPLRYGTGCVVNGIHVNNGHNIAATTFNPGVPVWIEGHISTGQTSINGVHYVKKESLTTFRIQALGSGSVAGEGGFVHIWRLHKSSASDPTLQNNGASGAYVRVNYGETALLHLFNGDSESQHFSFHGHRFNVIAENGFSVGAAHEETSLSVAAFNSYDVVLNADNPNRVGAWLIANDVQYNSEVPVNTPWPYVELNSTGIASYLDYTGFAQGQLVIDSNGDAVPISWLPPACSVQYDEIQVLRDSLNWPFPTTGEVFVLLAGEATYGVDPVTGEPFGTLLDEYTWTLTTSPPGSTVNLWSSTEASTYVTGFDYNGRYVFTFTAAGQNAWESDPNLHVSCEATVTVLVCEDEKACANYNSANSLPIAFISPAISSLRLGVVETTVETTKRAEMVEYAPDQIGHANLTYYSANRLDAEGSFRVAEFYITTTSVDPTKDPNPLRPLYTDPWDAPTGLEFFRWSNEAANTDFWLDVDPAESNQDEWSFAIKQAVFDGRVETFGYILATNIGAGVSDGDLPPATQKVVYPMYLGTSTAGDSVHGVYFLILESSDEDFCAAFGCVYTPSFSLIPPSTDYMNPVLSDSAYVNYNLKNRINTGTFANQRATDFVFSVDPLPVPSPRFYVDGVDEPTYSPLKLVSWTYQNEDGTWETRDVVANMPYIYWGSIDPQTYVGTTDAFTTAARAEGTMLIVERSDEEIATSSACDPLIFSFLISSGGYVPDEFFELSGIGFVNAAWSTSSQSFDYLFAQGPEDCWKIDFSTVKPTDVWQRPKGGQLLDVPDFHNMLVVMKTHRATYDGEVVPYFSVTDTSGFQEALMYGVPWTPALNKLGSGGEKPYVASYVKFGNGIPGDGTLGFQDPTVSTTPVLNSWTPFWEVSSIFWNCGTFEASQSISSNGYPDADAYDALEDYCFATQFDTDNGSPATLDLTCNNYDGDVIVGVKSFVYGQFTYSGTPTCSINTVVCNSEPAYDYFFNSDNWKNNCLGQSSCQIDFAEPWNSGGGVGPVPDDALPLLSPCLAYYGGAFGSTVQVQVVLECSSSAGSFSSQAIPFVVKDPSTLHNSPVFGPFEGLAYPLAGGLDQAVCPDFVREYSEGDITRVASIPSLAKQNVLFVTGNPPGAPLTVVPNILNAHVPYVFRPNAVRDPADWVPDYSATLVSAPIIQGVWGLVWNSPTSGEVLLAVRPSVKGAEPYWPTGNSYAGDFPPVETWNSQSGACPNCAWEGVYVNDVLNGSPFWIAQEDILFSPYGEPPQRHVFRLSTPDEAVVREDVIKYVLLECNDEGFATAFGARYEENLPVDLASSNVFWEEPMPDEAGNYLPEVVNAALNSFTFGDVPASILPRTTPNPLYTPFKLFEFQGRFVVCNMPFVQWGDEMDAPGMALANYQNDPEDDACQADLRADLGLPDKWFPNGPPGCEAGTNPLAVFRGAQVLAIDEWTSSVAVKIHRAVNKNDNTYYYYTVWSSSDPVEANYYGVPVTPSLTWATEKDYVWYFGNGVMCETCNPFNFQDPILGEWNPVRAVTNLLWNCDGVWASGNNNLFKSGTFCTGSGAPINCDPFPLNTDLKGRECDAWVWEQVSSGMVFADAVPDLLKNGSVFATYSPLGAPLTRAQEVVNAPILLHLDFSDYKPAQA